MEWGFSGRTVQRSVASIATVEQAAWRVRPYSYGI